MKLKNAVIANSSITLPDDIYDAYGLIRSLNSILFKENIKFKTVNGSESIVETLFPPSNPERLHIVAADMENAVKVIVCLNGKLTFNRAAHVSIENPERIYTFTKRKNTLDDLIKTIITWYLTVDKSYKPSSRLEEYGVSTSSVTESKAKSKSTDVDGASFIPAYGEDGREALEEYASMVSEWYAKNCHRLNTTNQNVIRQHVAAARTVVGKMDSARLRSDVFNFTEALGLDYDDSDNTIEVSCGDCNLVIRERRCSDGVLEFNVYDAGGNLIDSRQSPRDSYNEIINAMRLAIVDKVINIK